MKKILLVDDDERLLDLYKEAIGAEGYEVSKASDGEKALAKITEEKPDLVILDLMMPSIQGVDTLDIIKATPGVDDVKIIVLTAVSDEKVKSEALKLGADEYYVKSQVSLQQLIDKINEMLKKE